MIVKKTFGGSEIEFEPFVANGNVMVNATEMAKVFPNKRMSDFVSNQSTKEFIEECLKNGNSRFLRVEKEEDLIVSKQKSGTWMHRVLALKFAAWLNPAFELWVYQTIEEIMFGFSREQDESIRRTIIIQHELSDLEKKPNKTGEDFNQYMKLKDQLVAERASRASNTRNRFRQFYQMMSANFKTN